MSCLHCDRCSRLIDSDYDLDCFVNDGDYIVCETCRDRMEIAGELDVETLRTIEPAQQEQRS